MSEFVLVFIAASVDVVMDDVCSVELKIVGAYRVCMRELMEISEFVFMFTALSVEVVIDDVCSVELNMFGVISVFPKIAVVPIVDPKIFTLLPKLATPSVDIFVEAVTFPIISVDRPTNKEESAKISCVKLAFEKTDMPA
jgi:hypothetical protein